MKLPAVAIAALFAGGIALGLHPLIAQRATSYVFLVSCFTAVTLAVIFGLIFSQRSRLFPATICSASAWALLGVLATVIAEQPRSATHVLSLLDSEQIELKAPLRWHGRLRDEPTRLPWGYGYEIDLSGVEYQDAALAANGGLRLSLTTHPDQQLPPEVHTSDEITVVTQARLPQIFRDDGAFDRRAYLA